MFLADLWRIVWHWRLHLPFHHIPEVLYWCIRKARRIINDSSHPSPRLLSLLPSGRRLRSIGSRTSFFPQAIRLMNSQKYYTLQHNPTLRYAMHCNLTLTQFKLDYTHTLHFNFNTVQTGLHAHTALHFNFDTVQTGLHAHTTLHFNFYTFQLDYTHTLHCTLTLTQFKLDYTHTLLCTLTFTHFNRTTRTHCTAL